MRILIHNKFYKNYIKNYFKVKFKKLLLSPKILTLKIYSFLVRFRNLFFKFIDFLLIPYSKLMGKRGFYVFELKTSSFGHHLQEAITIYFLTKSKIKKEKIILLANKKKSLVRYTNVLLSQKFKIIENFNFLNPYFWLARSKHCGLSKEDENHLEKSYRILYENRKSLNIFNFDFLEKDEEVLREIKKFNPHNKFIVVWKPRCTSETQKGYQRRSSLKSCIPLFNKIQKEGGIVFGLYPCNSNFNHPNLINMNSVKDREIREKLIFWADYKCKFGIIGQTGGVVPLTIFMKPIIVYDAAYPYTLNFGGTKTIISLKKAFYPDGRIVNLKTLVSLKNKKQLNRLGIKFENNNSEDLLAMYEELKNRLKKYQDEFSEDSYLINNIWGKSIPRNIYNRFSHCQIANCCYKKQINSLGPSTKN